MISLPYFSVLLVSLICYWLIRRQAWRNVLLILSSFVFLYFTDKWSIAVVVGLSLFTYGLGLLIYKYPRRGYIHLLGVLGILAILVTFKYLGFLTGVINNLSEFVGGLPQFRFTKLLLPLGISYIVFKHLSYITDIKWRIVKPGKLSDFLLYSSLFTIFVAGPIERFERFKPQVENKRLLFVRADFKYGLKRIAFGMFQKLVIADWLAYIVKPIWDDPGAYSVWAGSLALLGYSLQIYFDFAGYSDIAIGSSRLFGIRIMENFDNPYLAPNISQFWRRWHISLSDWIRDYIFFPLSGILSWNLWKIVAVPVIAMAICGLWHGAGWNYVVWGVWHGMGLAAFKIWSNYKREHKNLAQTLRSPVFNYLSMCCTFVFVTCGWLAFRGGLKLINHTFGLGWLLIMACASIFFIITHGIYVKRVAPRTNNRFAVALAMLAVMLSFSMMDTGFIYANF